MRSALLSFFLLFFIIPQLSKAQSVADSLLQQYISGNPQEKVFLQTDRPAYFAGETIWMKAWCTVDGIPTYLSKILYVDLVNEKGQVLQKKMYKLDSLGSTGADFDIPSTITSGTYSLNAYTLWMQNFPEFIFRKEILLYGNDHKSQNQQTVTPSVKIQFFPEGGDMVEGLNNRVAFKAISNKGLPVSIKGYLSDNTGKRIADIATEHDGMGVFELMAEPGKTYTCFVPAGNGADQQFRLPQVKQEGVILKVENSNPKKLFVLLERGDNNKQHYSKIKIVAQLNYAVVFEANLDLDKDQNAVAIDKKNLPAGIIQITAFDNNHNPLAERLAFIENYSIIKPNLVTDTLRPGARASNHFTFSVPAPHSSLSVAVTNANMNDNSMDHNIASAFLLTADLKGYIHQPGYYFKDKEATTLKHLDILLMTHGWRRFEWKKIIAQEYPSLKYPVESGIWLTGKVTKSDRTEAVKEGKVAFIIRGEDSTTILADASITDKGEFLIKELTFLKKASIAYQGTNNKKEKLIVDVHLQPSYIDSLTRSSNKPAADLDTLGLSGALAKYFEAHVLPDTSFGSGYLGNVTVKAKKMSREDSLNNEYASGLFIMGKAIDPSGFKHYTTPWQILQASTPGIRVEGNPFDPNVFFTRFQGLDALSQNNSSITLGESSSGETVGLVLEENGIAYFLNEINVSKDVINSLSVDDISLIKVLKNEGAVLGATAGAIAFYTKKGLPVSSNVYEKNFTRQDRLGYAVVRQFYTPDVAALPQGSNQRITLYWNSNIRLAKDGKYHIPFQNDDTTKEFRIIIQGIDHKGQLIFMEKLLR